jgi:hypothetical protein
MKEYKTLVELYWQVDTESLGEKLFSVPLNPPQIQQIMASYWTMFPHGEWVSTDRVRLVRASVGLSRVLEYISIFHDIITTHKILQWLEDIGTSNRVNPNCEA